MTTRSAPKSPESTEATLHERIWEYWKDACERDGGKTTIPAHLVQDFHILLNRRGVTHAFRNVRSDGEGTDEQFQNQITVPNPDGVYQHLVFDIFTPTPL